MILETDPILPMCSQDSLDVVWPMLVLHNYLFHLYSKMFTFNNKKILMSPTTSCTFFTSFLHHKSPDLFHILP